MGKLGNALPQERADFEPAVKSDRGGYRGFFIGMTAPYEWVSPFGDPCRVCKGAKTGRNGEGVCFLCVGTGKRTEQRAKLRYALENHIVEEEEVNYKISPPSQSREGNALSPTTLYVRLRDLSGLQNPTPAQLDDWYSSLPEPIKIPVMVMINDNKSGTGLKIVSVMRLDTEKPKAAPKPAPVADEYDDDAFAGIEGIR